MSRTPEQSPPQRGEAPLHVVQVLGGEGDAGAVEGAHVRSLAAGLVDHGLRVTVCAPPQAEERHDFTAAGARFVPVRGRGRVAAPGVLRAVCAGAGLVHAHGLRAGLLATFARGRRGRGVPLVVTLHGPEPFADTRSAPPVRLGERRVALASAVVLGATTGLVDLARAHGARDARLAPVALRLPVAADPPRSPLRPPDGEAAAKTRAEVGAVERPLLFALGGLEPLQGYGTVLTAARAWRDLEPPPLLAIAGEGPQRAELQARIDAETLPVRLLGERADAFDLLAVADIAVLAACPESGPLAREALRGGIPLVAAAAAGTSELVGDGGLLVPCGDADALAEAVAGLLADPGRRTALAAAARARAAAWPTEDRTVAQVLSVYDELTG
ncbi:glycosyltransferase family 4 protein [Streptomyces sp. N2-109]|uniref:D-inositol 3-phosphate glycosyltransferase n=1 Tax=Streptomyces gossypii TaxID=2883101 RepID=A0ABT2JMD7_9ACTN|nr:glycosyltransferase family 4 protein [Streptomyces gossypii]MCT2588976.1 glycosyltransferase family 4 protein [Streptomyces gossypii]